MGDVTTAASGLHGIPVVFFGIIALWMIVSALGTVLAKNPINSVLFLVTNLLGVAVMYAALGAHFLAVVQVIVYAGAIVVLFLFVVMLLNVKVEREGANSLLFKVAATMCGVVFVALVARAYLPGMEDLLQTGFILEAQSSNGSSDADGTVKAIGRELFTKHVFIFEAVSLVLIVAMVAAVMLAGQRNRGEKLLKQNPKQLGIR
jgi:NADH-quinone oxidoreductase subunit J